MFIRKFALVVTVGFALVGACAVTSEDMSELHSALDGDPCTAEKAEFENWAAAAACEKSNPARFSTAFDLIVKAGATCTAEDDAGTCSSIDPIEDSYTKQISQAEIICWEETLCQEGPCGPTNCRKYDKCCIGNVSLGLLNFCVSGSFK